MNLPPQSTIYAPIRYVWRPRVPPHRLDARKETTTTTVGVRETKKCVQTGSEPRLPGESETKDNTMGMLSYLPPVLKDLVLAVCLISSMFI